jgi:predicted DNA-binding transcriptional regulator AlpA
MATAEKTQKTETLNIHQVAELLGVSVSTVRNWLRDGRFPRPLSISPNKYLWARRTIDRVLKGEFGLRRKWAL